MAGIFISYRRDDAQGEARHLADDLEKRFPGQVFMDVTGIEPGRDFRKVIDTAVSSCDILIVVIGRDWLSAADAQGRRRLDDAKDFVRLETGAALARDIPVIPVLVQGAVMPTTEQLPPDLEALAWRNAFELRHTRWSSDLDLLLQALSRIVPAPQPSAPPPPAPAPTRLGPVVGGAAAVMVLGIGGLVWWQGQGPNDGAASAPSGGTVATVDRPGASAPSDASKPSPAPPPQKSDSTRPVTPAPKPAPRPAPKPEPQPGSNAVASQPAPTPVQPPAPVRAAPEPYTVTRAFNRSGGLPGRQMSDSLEVFAGFETRGTLAFEVEVPHSCSMVRLHVLVDGQRRMVTPFFQERSGRIEVGDVGEGSHQLRLLPEGRLGGCNVGTLQSWGGTLTLYLTR